MDPLYQSTKELYPDVDDDELNASLADMRKESPPGTTDESIKNAIGKAFQDGEYGGKAETVKNNLKEKYGLGEFSQQARQKLVDEKDNSGSKVGSFFAGFGAGIRGGNVSDAYDSAMKGHQSKAQGALDNFDKAREGKKSDFAYDQQLDKADREQNILNESRDPASARSKAAQDMLIQDYGMDPASASKMSAEQVEARIPGLKLKLDRQMKERELGEKRQDRQLQRESMNANKQAVRDEKQGIRDEKKKATLDEVEDRRTNIEDNITILEKMINEDGTYEAFGSHNADMGRLVDQIATDMAKLTDPNSVARPSEVDMFKKGLVQPGVSMRNSTALDILKNFRSEVNTRAQNAYKIRGLENPGSQADKTNPKEETKTVEGVVYRKIPGGWEEVQ